MIQLMVHRSLGVLGVKRAAACLVRKLDRPDGGLSVVHQLDTGADSSAQRALGIAELAESISAACRLSMFVLDAEHIVQDIHLRPYIPGDVIKCERTGEALPLQADDVVCESGGRVLACLGSRRLDAMETHVSAWTQFFLMLALTGNDHNGDNCRNCCVGVLEGLRESHPRVYGQLIPMIEV